MSVLRTQLAGVSRRPARLLLPGLAVLVVSFVVYATVLVQEITERTVLDRLSGTPAAVDLVVYEGVTTTADLAAIGKLDGVAEAVGRVQGGAQIGRESLMITADPGSGPLAVTTLAQGRFPNRPGEIAVTPRTLERMGLAVGKSLTASLGYDNDLNPRPPRPVKVVGVVTAADDNGFQAYAPQAVVTAMTGQKELSQIDVRVRPGADPLGVEERIEALLDGAERADLEERPLVSTGAAIRQIEARRAAGEVGTVFAAIGMFIVIAVVAAGLVATSTFRIVFAQRMRQLALLRAVGAGRGSIIRSLAAEGALIGLTTGLAAMLLALGAGHLVPLGLGLFGKEVAAPGFPLAAAAGTVALAVVITVLAVLAPAASAAKVSPLEALRSAATAGARRDIGKLRWTIGLLLAGGAALVAAIVVMGLPGRNPQNYDPEPILLAVVGSGALAFFALIALGPALVRPALAVLGWPVRRVGALGRLAAGGVGGAPRRAAAVSVVVALGVTLIAGVLVSGSSLRILADRQAAASAPADYQLTAAATGGVLPATMVDQLRNLPELANVTPYRRLGVTIGDNGMEANDLAVSALPQLKKLDVTAGSLAALEPGRVVISGVAAELTGLTVGSDLTVTHGKKKAQLSVVAVLPDSAPLGSALLLDPADLTRLGAGRGYSGLLADASGTGEQARTDGRKAINDVQTAAGNKWKIDVLADRRDQVNDQITMLLVIALGLVGLTVLIAVVGVGTTTALSVVERARESGTLRAIGLSRGGLRAMLTTESALYGLIGAGTGVVLGVPYAWLAVKALGVNAPLTLPIGQLAAVFATLVLLTALAGALPARRAARVSPIAALSSE
jgi:putative ABC transport system permease protein